MRELNVNEIQEVNGGFGWLRWLRPTMMGDGEMPKNDGSESCPIGWEIP
ncbi:hypothetical protein ORJ66_15205 [Pseudoalteromonas tunicata]|nr:hypothetical protein [Pseudoalteromonas tunicata]MDP5214402.1 hypothetical protein [Pseudoalteromonas tunicata]